MKHAHLVRNLILAVTDESGAKFGTPSVEITDEQAATVAALKAANKKIQLVNGVVSEVVPVSSGPTPIQLGERHVSAAGLSGPRLVTLMDLLLQVKEANSLASKPKLVALYTWLQTVKGLALAGQVAFPAAPHTFEEVVSE